MSLACCMDCGAFINTDDDPDSTYYEGGCVCESCREDTKQKPIGVRNTLTEAKRELYEQWRINQGNAIAALSPHPDEFLMGAISGFAAANLTPNLTT